MKDHITLDSILAEINNSNLLLDIMYDIQKKPRPKLPVTTGTLKSSEILMSQYAIA